MILQKGRYTMLIKEAIKGYKELKAERSQFKQKCLDSIDKILDDIHIDIMEECFEVRTELDTAHLMCTIADNTIVVAISNNTKLDFTEIELDKNEVIKGMSLISPKDASEKINQFIHQNSPTVPPVVIGNDTKSNFAPERYSVYPEGVLNKLEKFYDNNILINGHKNILIQILDELIVAETLKTDAIKDDIISTLKRKIHNRMIKIDELELHQISEEKQLRQYAAMWDLNLVEDLIEKINYQKDVINIIIQYKEDQLKISRMKNINPTDAIEKLESLLNDANDRFIKIETAIDKIYNKLMK